MKTKICKHKTCLKEKSIVEFNKASRELDGYNRVCKTCQSEIGKQYYANNKEQINEKHREKYNSNPKPVLEKQQKYYQNNKNKKAEYAKANKENIIENRRKNDKKRRENIFFRLKKNISRAINRVITSQESKKNGSSRKYLPFSDEQLRSHIEDNFEPWMTWDNHGVYNKSSWDNNDTSTWTWQIDHIIPQSDLPYKSMKDPNFKLAWSLFNLRPYPSKYNLLEGVSRLRHVPDRDLTSKHKLVEYIENNSDPDDTFLNELKAKYNKQLTE